MELESFQRSFKNYEINIMPYISVVSVFVGIILVILLLNNNLEDTFLTKAIVEDNKVNIVVSIDDLDKVVNNKKIIIEKDIFTYRVNKIENVVYQDNIYKSVILDIYKLGQDKLINNNVIDLKIIINKMTIFDYLVKTLKGEWKIKKISKEELKKINGGGLSGVAIAGIIAGAIFLIGVIDGYVRPKKCNE